MAVLDKIKNWFTAPVIEVPKEEPKNIGLQTTPFSVGDFNLTLPKKDNMSEVTYYTCIKILSESLGKLNLELKQKTKNNGVKTINNNLSTVLKVRPNPYMSPSSFWSTVETHRLHWGNAYVWIQRNGTKLENLWILNPTEVEIFMDDLGLFGKTNALFYRYCDARTGHIYLFNAEDILHFRNSSTYFNGIVGMSVGQILKTTMDGKLASQDYLNNLYKSGMTGKAVLQYTGDLSPEAQQRLMNGLESFANGSNNAGKIIPIPLGTTLTPLNVDLADSQFVELKQYTDKQIASAFGVPTSKLNNLEQASFASVEAQNLSFLVDTMSYILKIYDEELTYKLLSSTSISQGYHFEFDVNSLLRCDINSQITFLSTAVNNGLMTQNEARAKLGLQTMTGADVLFVNGTNIPSEMLGQQYSSRLPVKGGENGA